MASSQPQASPSPKTLDHIVHLTPPGTVDETAEQFRRLGFHVIPGGTHADGLTANALVIMPDGIYLELISFTHPEAHYPPSSPAHDARHRHQWANKPPGWVAYAHLGAPGSVPPLSTLLNARLEDIAPHSGTHYAHETAGGRTRPDGVVLKWELTTPTRWAERVGGTRLPFFCGDVTPRELRVPTQPASNTVHPNGAQSIAHLRVLAPRVAFTDVSAELTAITGEAPIELSASEHVWLLDVPGNVAPKWHPKLILSEPEPDDQTGLEFVEKNGPGLFEIGVRVDGKGDDSSETPFGRVVWVPV
ncbi:glyoxalase-like domain-containing protein [Gloeopeniophorella convolvens]|nr:glyoxalase-like domain-containing protein [Gloeopeniophorella convolvens]